MSNFARRHRRTLAGMLVGALALSVSPILGITGVASAADPLPPIAEPIGEGNFCEGAPTTEPFTDVTESDPSLDEIICLVATELTSGTTATTYSPNGNITRRQMALFIKRLADLANELELVDLADLPAYDGTPDFTDLTGESAEALQAIGQLFQADIVQGVTATEFRPGDPVSRRQMAAFIVRLQDFLGSTPFEPIGNAFDDDDDESAEVQANFNILGGEGIFQGDGVGNVFPGNPITRRQMANVLLRKAQVLFANGDIAGAFDVTPESLITVDPAGPAILEVSGTPGTPTGERALREYTIMVDDAACSAIDIGLIPFTNLAIADDGTVTFTDVDGQANRADGLGATNARIETVNGVANLPISDGNDYENNVAVPANGIVTVTVNSETVNTAVALVAYCDDDNNDQLNLDSDDHATEEFGLGGVQFIIPEEAADLQTGTAEVAVLVEALNLFTSDAQLLAPPGTEQFAFNYDDNDDFNYEAVSPAQNISLTEFETWVSGVETGQIGDITLGRRINSAFLGGDPAESTVLGDVIDYAYRTDPAGESTFDLVEDVPGAITDLSVTVADPDGDGADEFELMWTGVTNPNTAGYDVFAREVINGIPVDPAGPASGFMQVNTDIVLGNTFVEEFDGSPVDAGETFQFVVVARSESLGLIPESYGPDSNLVEIMATADDSVLPLLSQETDLVAAASTPGEFDDEDALRIEFNQAVAVAANASVKAVDLSDGDFATLTCGGNATCVVGPANFLEIELNADPTVQGPGLPANNVFDSGNGVAIQEATGVTAVAGPAWHIPASGIQQGAEGFGIVVPALADDLDRVGFSFGLDLPDGIDTGFVDVQDSSTTLSIDPAAEGGTSDIENGDTVRVYDAAGAVVGTTPWSSVVGAAVNVGLLPAGTLLFVDYIDDDGDGIGIGIAGAEVRSGGTAVLVAGDAPVVASVDTFALNTIDVVFSLPDPPLTQVGPPSNYQVFDEDNTDLVRTGTSATVIAPDTIRVVLNGPLVVGTDYALRVAASTVQNNNNVPNAAEVFDFTFAPVPVPPNPAPPTMISAVASDVFNVIVATYSEAVTCDAVTAPWTYDDQSVSNDSDGSPTSVVQGGADQCLLAFANLANNDFGQLTYLQPVAPGDRIVDSQGQEALSQAITVQDQDFPALSSVLAAVAGTNLVQVTFDEPISCASTANSDFVIVVDGGARNVTGDNCGGAADAVFNVTFDGAATVSGNVVEVSIAAGMVTDQFGNGNFAAVDVSDTVA